MDFPRVSCGWPSAVVFDLARYRTYLAGPGALTSPRPDRGPSPRWRDPINRGGPTSAAVALAMRAIHKFARQYVVAGPFSRGHRAPCRREASQPRFWRLLIADAISFHS